MRLVTSYSRIPQSVSMIGGCIYGKSIRSGLTTEVFEKDVIFDRFSGTMVHMYVGSHVSLHIKGSVFSSGKLT